MIIEVKDIFSKHCIDLSEVSQITLINGDGYENKRWHYVVISKEFNSSKPKDKYGATLNLSFHEDEDLAKREYEHIVSAWKNSNNSNMKKEIIDLLKDER